MDSGFFFCLSDVLRLSFLWMLQVMIKTVALFYLQRVNAFRSLLSLSSLVKLNDLRGFSWIPITLMAPRLHSPLAIDICLPIHGNYGAPSEPHQAMEYKDHHPYIFCAIKLESQLVAGRSLCYYSDPWSSLLVDVNLPIHQRKRQNIISSYMYLHSPKVNTSLTRLGQSCISILPSDSPLARCRYSVEGTLGARKVLPA